MEVLDDTHDARYRGAVAFGPELQSQLIGFRIELGPRERGEAEVMVPYACTVRQIFIPSRVASSVHIDRFAVGAQELLANVDPVPGELFTDLSYGDSMLRTSPIGAGERVVIGVQNITEEPVRVDMAIRIAEVAAPPAPTPWLGPPAYPLPFALPHVPTPRELAGFFDNTAPPDPRSLPLFFGTAPPPVFRPGVDVDIFAACACGSGLPAALCHPPPR